MSAPGELVILNRAAKIEISLDQSRLVIRSENAIIRPPVTVVAFLALVFQAAPNIVEYNTINSKILEPRAIAQPPSDTLNYIRKLKLRSERIIAEITGLEGSIEAVRSVGYRLADDWEVSGTTFPVELQRLAQVLNETVDLMLQTPLVEGEQGALSLAIPANGEQLSSLVFRFDECATDLQLRLGSATQSARLARDLLVAIRSYVGFARTGNVDKETWRQLFVSELQRCFDHLCEVALG